MSEEKQETGPEEENSLPKVETETKAETNTETNVEAEAKTNSDTETKAETSADPTPESKDTNNQETKPKESAQYKGDTHTTDFRDDGMWPAYANPNFKMADEIEVHVKAPTGDYSFPVKIEKAKDRKLYFGGYKHAKSKLVYHNASTQTPTESKRVEGATNLRTRETQTYDMKSISVQPNREHGTQMQRVDLYLDNHRDTEITPKAYFTSDDLMFLKRVKCVEVQRVWRGKMARGRADRMRKAMIANEEKELKER